MPLYKYIGNKILTSIQNCLLGMNLSEFHSGYRVYSVEALKRIPFKYNTNDFHFDTEIIIQLRLGGLRIKELPIPTYYGDEICHVNGLAYAWHVVMATLASRIQGLGLLFQRKYDVMRAANIYDIKLGYASSHTFAIEAVKRDTSVLDLACGKGYVARELRKKGCRVTGVDRTPAEPGLMDRFILQDLDADGLPSEVRDSYDYILGLDCLEHLNSPEGFLADLRSHCYGEKTTLVFTVPNVGFFFTRLSLLVGEFNYGRQGILDLTHKRLFTFRSFRWMLEHEGYRVLVRRGIPAPYPKAMGDNLFSRCLLAVNRALIPMWPQMFSYQIYIEAKFLPPVDRLLAQTIQASSERTRKDSHR
jgi:SAM-dependent methyltransferase